MWKRIRNFLKKRGKSSSSISIIEFQEDSSDDNLIDDEDNIVPLIEDDTNNKNIFIIAKNPVLDIPFVEKLLNDINKLAKSNDIVGTSKSIQLETLGHSLISSIMEHHQPNAKYIRIMAVCQCLNKHNSSRVEIRCWVDNNKTKDDAVEIAENMMGGHHLSELYRCSKCNRPFRHLKNNYYPELIKKSIVFYHED